MTMPPMEAPAPMQPPVSPWTPFTPLPTDEEPRNAELRMRRLSRLIDSAKFETYDGLWQQVAIQEYQRMAQIVAAAQQPAMPEQGQPGQPKPKDEQKPSGPPGPP